MRDYCLHALLNRQKRITFMYIKCMAEFIIRFQQYRLAAVRKGTSGSVCWYLRTSCSKRGAAFAGFLNQFVWSVLKNNKKLLIDDKV